jgi:hypothetical protein
MPVAPMGRGLREARRRSIRHIFAVNRLRQRRENDLDACDRVPEMFPKKR